MVALEDTLEEVTTSATARTAGDYVKAKTEIEEALAGFQKVQPTLAAHNGADVTLKTALTNYLELVSAEADQAKAATASQTAHDAVLVAQQVLVGPFWTDPALHAKIAAMAGTAGSGSSAAGATPPTTGAGSADKVSANAATVEELAAALAAAGIPNADRWAAEIEEYRPYPEDPSWAKLRQELGKYKIDPAVLEKIISILKQ